MGPRDAAATGQAVWSTDTITTMVTVNHDPSCSLRQLCAHSSTPAVPIQGTPGNTQRPFWLPHLGEAPPASANWTRAENLTQATPTGLGFDPRDPGQSLLVASHGRQTLLTIHRAVNMTKATVSYRQEKTHMMSTMDRSFTDQTTLQENERLGLSFLDAQGYSLWGVSACPFLVAPRRSCPRLVSQQHRVPHQRIL
uniref:Uncharacterized protein n=1 Tax=Rangifer tarandus platyrhynchus TaxID=3082113 RepID=A0ACB0ERG2_RANTA|nr:unnamed protein product [Rangifer tarandus platyrhynchus]